MGSRRSHRRGQRPLAPAGCSQSRRYDPLVPRGRSILLVAHVTPPTTMSAARRAAGLTKYLARAGHSVTVLTSVMSGSGPISGAARTVRTRDLLVSPLNWRRSGLAALQGDASATVAAAPSALAAWAVPDLQLAGWVPFALARAIGLARRERFDCVITTSPPASAHLIGLALRPHGLAWIADFRDGWTFETQRSGLGASLARRARPPARAPGCPARRCGQRGHAADRR